MRRYGESVCSLQFAVYSQIIVKTANRKQLANHGVTRTRTSRREAILEAILDLETLNSLVKMAALNRKSKVFSASSVQLRVSVAPWLIGIQRPATNELT